MYFTIYLLLVFLILYVSTPQTGGARNNKAFYIYPSEFKDDMMAMIQKGRVWSTVFTPVKMPENADFTIKVVPRKQMDSMLITPEKVEYYPNTKKRIHFSYTVNGQHIYIDEENWRMGVPESGLSVKDYRQYVLFHEIGHVLGYGHQPCLTKKCPIMYQMTRGPPTGYGQEGVELGPVDVKGLKLLKRL
jgi:hypothetical protein